MKKNLLTAGLLSLSISAGAQVVSTVDNGGVFFVGENALVYNGGGMQTRGTGQYDIRGNMMVVGGGIDAIRTLDQAGTAPKTSGGNIVLRLNEPTNYTSSTYGQLYIQGLAQDNVTGIVDKEYRDRKHGTYQQVAMPFHQKKISSLSAELGKTFVNSRRSKNEILVYDNTEVVALNVDVQNATVGKANSYYMLGSANLDTSTPSSGNVYTLRGMPVANGIAETLANAGASVNFGPTGNGRNRYNEEYKSYLQDAWDYSSAASNPYSVPTYGKNIYQFGNPYFTNLDLSLIGIAEQAAVSDGNQISSIRGIRYDPGTVYSYGNGSTYAEGVKFINFVNGTIPVGDVGYSIIKPMQTFVVKLNDNNAQVSGDRTLNFDTLRRFKSTPRDGNINYGVTAARGANTIKQLGVIGLDDAGNEIARTYYVVYADGVTGNSEHQTVQVTSSSAKLGTFEEHPQDGGIDSEFSAKYWLYINEANEADFKGKYVSLVLYDPLITKLKFEVREDAELLQDKAHALSQGIGFYYKTSDGSVEEVKNNTTIPVTANLYQLSYGKENGVLSTDVVKTPSRTRVIFNKETDAYQIRFDPEWKRADVKVYDMSGKLVISKSQISTGTDYSLPLQKTNSAYVVTAVSETGETATAKIIR